MADFYEHMGALMANVAAASGGIANLGAYRGNSQGSVSTYFPRPMGSFGAPPQAACPTTPVPEKSFHQELRDEIECWLRDALT